MGAKSTKIAAVLSFPLIGGLEPGGLVVKEGSSYGRNLLNTEITPSQATGAWRGFVHHPETKRTHDRYSLPEWIVQKSNQTF